MKPEIARVFADATLEWADWFNHRRLIETIGNIAPAKAEELYHAAADNIDMTA